MTTEAEASKRWCPLTTLHSARPTFLTSDSLYGACIGSHCMAWRWSTQLRRTYRIADDAAATVEPERPTWVPASWTWTQTEDGEPAGWLEPEADAQARRRGYCGLAGRPEEAER